MHNTILVIATVLIGSLTANGQFNTISSRGQYGLDIKVMETQTLNNKSNTNDAVSAKLLLDEICEVNMPDIDDTITDQKRNENKFIHPVVKSVVEPIEDKKMVQLQDTELPKLTIPNLLAEIKKNGIKYPKIVLAQAILETGWFKSSVCQNKHNLFGLTNPRTKTYYEFNHWTESVKAYYTKVQYRYKGGNYLLWLKKIGYAEDKGYIRAIISVLKQL